LDSDEVEHFDVSKISDDSPTGYAIECDLEYPPHLHDLHNDYPLAPESIVITDDFLSPYCMSFDQKHIEARKLTPNLMHKEKYVVHYQNLKFYLESGMILKKVHRVLSFDQSGWMEPFVAFNTKMRQQALTLIAQNFFKLVVNSNFGKTMENVRNRCKVELVSDPAKILKLSAKPQLDQFRVINDETALIKRVRAKVTLDKPIYCGFAILELSKLHMYRFHYDVIKKRYGDKAKLLFTDTDSLCYHIETTDVYEDMKGFLDKLDTSNYPRSHKLYSATNAKVLGKFKDETAGEPCDAFVGLRAKMYSLLVNKTKPAKMTAKGIKTHFVNKHLRHETYLHTLKTKTITHAKFRNFRSRCHNVETIEVNKICLSAFDDKRFILKDGESTLAYGHYKTWSVAERALL
jgi:hypothetical protein